QKPRSWPRWVNFTPALVGHFYIGGDTYCQHPVTGEINMIIPLLWFGLALLLGIVASSNGRSFWGWFILGLIIDPILAGLLYWLVCRDR
ncbi:hypothetical protein ACK311_20445, partial [Aeromonas caviae]